MQEEQKKDLLKKIINENLEQLDLKEVITVYNLTAELVAEKY